MHEISFEELKQEIQLYKSKDLYLTINTPIEVKSIIQKSNIIINNYEIFITDGKDLEICINVDVISKIEKSEDINSYTLNFDFNESAILHFDKNS